MSSGPALLLLALLVTASGTAPAQGNEAGSVGRIPADSGFDGGHPWLQEQIVAADENGDVELLPEEEGEGDAPGLLQIHWRTRMGGKIQRGRGYADGRYAGNRMKAYNRLTVSHGSWFSAGFLTEKDPGERSAADHISGSVSIGGSGGYPLVVAGDFRVRAGQRLVFAGGRAFGKGAEVFAPVRRTGWGISSSPTADEFNFQRGLALSVTGDGFGIAAFLSGRSHSAILSADGTISSLDETGYHRTATEIGRRDNLTRKSAGFLARFDHGQLLHLGLNAVRSTFTPSGVREASSPAGEVAERLVSLDFVLSAPVVIYGEIASRSGFPMGVVGVLVDDRPRVKIILSVRSYPDARGFTPSAGFGDRSGARNERGVYAGLEAGPVPQMTLRAYFDVFAARAPARDAFFPRRGVDRLLGVTFRSGRSLRIDARFRNRLAERKGAPQADGGVTTPANETLSESRWRFGMRWSKGVRLVAGIRIDYSRVSPGTSSPADRGVMLLADLRTGPVRDLDVNFRAIFFATDSYAARVYETEPDLPGSLTSGVLFGRGTRWYLVLSWRPSPVIRISTKFSRLEVTDRRNIGTGAEEIPGSVSEHLGVQIDVEL